MEIPPDEIIPKLHTYAAEGDIANMELEIENGADVNAVILYDITALHYAIRWHVEGTDALQLLIDSGADLDARDGMGRTALHFAAYLENYEQVQCLLDSGADPTIADNAGLKPAQQQLYVDADNDGALILKALTTAERRKELQQIAAQSRPSEIETAPPQRRSSGFMM